MKLEDFLRVGSSQNMNSEPYFNHLSNLAFKPVLSLNKLSKINEEFPLQDPFLETGSSAIRIYWSQTKVAAQEIRNSWDSYNEQFSPHDPFREVAGSTLRKAAVGTIRSLQLGSMAISLPFAIAAIVPGGIIGGQMGVLINRLENRKTPEGEKPYYAISECIQGIKSYARVSLRVHKSLGELARFAEFIGRNVDGSLIRTIYTAEGEMRRAAENLCSFFPEQLEIEGCNYVMQETIDRINSVRKSSKFVIEHSFPYEALGEKVDERHEAQRKLEYELAQPTSS